MVAVSALLRLVLGIPLLAELFSDWIIPSFSVSQFLRLSARLGGVERAKELTLLGGFGLIVIGGVFGGCFYAALLWMVRWATAALTAALVAVAVALSVFLWPSLASNYAGFPPRPARALAIVGIALTLAAFGLVVVPTTRAGLRMLVAEKPSPGHTGEPSVAGVPRRALVLGGAMAVLALAAGGLTALLYRRGTVGPNGYDGLQTRGPNLTPITPNDRFYVVTKNLVDPHVDRSRWRLQVTGLVEQPRTYDFASLVALPSVDQEQTLQCISNGIGAGLISNALWHGVPMLTLLRAARPLADARQVVLHASDGYIHTVPLAKAMEPTTILAYQMNGRPLPDRHGFPVRALVPGTFGEVSVKWIDRIEVGPGGVEGYYERQGWMAQFVPTRSRIDDPRNGQTLRTGAGPVVVRGIAFAGDRGISKVEVSTDGEATWAPARIDYDSSNLAWVLWSFDWTPPNPGRYELTVRATDGDGDPQTAERRGVAPRGATGYHQIAVRVTG
jgi:DMSO/TMAO reductase YedYZ molybdopterin-dependent catalytic subunit